MKYTKEIYYYPPIPHCTIGSCVGDLSEKAKELGFYGNDVVEVDDYDSDDEDCIELDVNEIFLSIGNQTYTIQLHSCVCFPATTLSHILLCARRLFPFDRLL